MIMNVTKNRPSILIELNDASHWRPETRERDERLKEFSEDTNTPLLIIWTRSRYNTAEIKKKIKECIESGGVMEY